MADQFFFAISAFDFSGKQGRAIAMHNIAALRDQTPAPMRNGRERYMHSAIKLDRQLRKAQFNPKNSGVLFEKTEPKITPAQPLKNQKNQKYLSIPPPEG